jgi:hypothetical protein
MPTTIGYHLIGAARGHPEPPGTAPGPPRRSFLRMLHAEMRVSDTPEPEWLSLADALRLAIIQTRLDPEILKRDLLLALRDGSLRARADETNYEIASLYPSSPPPVPRWYLLNQDDWELGEINWYASIIKVSQQHLQHRNKYIKGIQVQRGALVNWCHTSLDIIGGENGDRLPARVQHIVETPKSRGGRKPEYDWDGFWIEIVRVADRDGLPGPEQSEGWRYQADLVRHMLEWFQNTHGKEPAKSQIEERLTKLYKSCR